MWFDDDDIYTADRSGFGDYLIDGITLLTMVGLAGGVIALVLWLVPALRPWVMA